MYIVAIGWLYVAMMMAVAEATSSTGTVLGAIVTFVLYGALPVVLVVYLMGTPSRKRAIRARLAAEQAAADFEAAAAASGQPHGGRETAADPVAPVRKEP